MNQKTVCQLDSDDYFIGVTVADESPLEQGIFLLPHGCVDTDPPVVLDGQRAKWNNGWLIEVIPTPEPEPIPEPIVTPYTDFRRGAYNSESDPIFFKAQRGEATIEEWLLQVQEIKQRYPKS